MPLTLAARPSISQRQNKSQPTPGFPFIPKELWFIVWRFAVEDAPWLPVTSIYRLSGDNLEYDMSSATKPAFHKTALVLSLVCKPWYNLIRKSKDHQYLWATIRVCNPRQLHINMTRMWLIHSGFDTPLTIEFQDTSEHIQDPAWKILWLLVAQYDRWKYADFRIASHTWPDPFTNLKRWPRRAKPNALVSMRLELLNCSDSQIQKVWDLLHADNRTLRDCYYGCEPPLSTLWTTLSGLGIGFPPTLSVLRSLSLCEQLHTLNISVPAKDQSWKELSAEWPGYVISLPRLHTLIVNSPHNSLLILLCNMHVPSLKSLTLQSLSTNCDFIALCQSLQESQARLTSLQIMQGVPVEEEDLDFLLFTSTTANSSDALKSRKHTSKSIISLSELWCPNFLYTLKEFTYYPIITEKIIFRLTCFDTLHFQPCLPNLQSLTIRCATGPGTLASMIYSRVEYGGLFYKSWKRYTKGARGPTGNEAFLKQLQDMRTPNSSEFSSMNTGLSSRLDGRLKNVRIHILVDPVEHELDLLYLEREKRVGSSIIFEGICNNV